MLIRWSQIYRLNTKGTNVICSKLRWHVVLKISQCLCRTVATYKFVGVTNSTFYSHNWKMEIAHRLFLYHSRSQLGVGGGGGWEKQSVRELISSSRHDSPLRCKQSRRPNSQKMTLSRRRSVCEPLLWLTRCHDGPLTPNPHRSASA